jgi:molecular chaperone DnaJ
MGHEAFSGGYGSQGYSWQGTDFSSIFEDLGIGGSGGSRTRGYTDFSDLFGGMFGQGRGGSTYSNIPVRGEDLEYKLELSLEQAVYGTTTRIRLARSGSEENIEVKIPPGVDTDSRVPATSRF